MPTGVYERTKEHKRNASIANTGKVRTKEHRKNMSIAQMGLKRKKKKIKYKRISSPYPDLKSDCLMPFSHCKRKGYPLIRRKRKTENMSRYVYKKFCGKIPRGMFVLHKCDRPGCIQPDHLFLGTAKDNNQDCVKKGRWSNSKKNKN